jgi:hypothetical protein
LLLFHLLLVIVLLNFLEDVLYATVHPLRGKKLRFGHLFLKRAKSLLI